MLPNNRSTRDFEAWIKQTVEAASDLLSLSEGYVPPIAPSAPSRQQSQNRRSVPSQSQSSRPSSHIVVRTVRTTVSVTMTPQARSYIPSGGLIPVPLPATLRAPQHPQSDTDATRSVTMTLPQASTYYIPTGGLVPIPRPETVRAPQHPQSDTAVNNGTSLRVSCKREHEDNQRGENNPQAPNFGIDEIRQEHKRHKPTLT